MALSEDFYAKTTDIQVKTYLAFVRTSNTAQTKLISSRGASKRRGIQSNIRITLLKV